LFIGATKTKWQAGPSRKDSVKNKFSGTKLHEEFGKSTKFVTGQV